jgi:hypothetical protein
MPMKSFWCLININGGPGSHANIYQTLTQPPQAKKMRHQASKAWSSFWNWPAHKDDLTCAAIPVDTDNWAFSRIASTSQSEGSQFWRSTTLFQKQTADLINHWYARGIIMSRSQLQSLLSETIVLCLGLHACFTYIAPASTSCVACMLQPYVQHLPTRNDDVPFSNRVLSYQCLWVWGCTALMALPPICRQSRLIEDCRWKWCLCRYHRLQYRYYCWGLYCQQGSPRCRSRYSWEGPDRLHDQIKKCRADWLNQSTRSMYEAE